MILKMTSKNQVTFPKEVCRSLGLKKGSRIEIFKKSGDWRLRLWRINEGKLAPLRGLLKKGKGAFNIHRFRKQKKNYAKLRN